MNTMNDAGYALLRHWEGCILYTYDDATGRRVGPGDKVLGTITIGYGHTGGDVVAGHDWTQAQADAMLAHDVDLFARKISSLITVDLNDNQFSAFVCFSFNIGIQAFLTSSALHLANAGQLADVPEHIMLWNKANVGGVPKPSPGLIHRRQAEVDLWNS